MAADDTRTPRRGAWYMDPYGSGLLERWWDGSKWTKHVREALPPDAAPAIRTAAPPAASGAAFRLSFDDVVGDDLRLQPRGDKRLMQYELVLGFRQRVAELSIGGQGALAHMECSEGEWRLLKRQRLGWELIVEAADGHVVAWYSGRRWRPGGTIFLSAGPQFDLIRSAFGEWTLRTVEREESLVRMHGYAAPLRVELVSAPRRFPDAHLAVLTSCAIPLLEERLTLRRPGVR